MADTVSQEKRSQIMSNIKSSDTSIEIVTRKYLFSKGFRFRKNVRKLPGRPDIVLPMYKTVVFIHGCFWHGHGNCPCSHVSKTRVDYWNEKIKKNIKRDHDNQQKLREMGWKTIIVWECELKKHPGERLEKLIGEIKNL